MEKFTRAKMMTILLGIFYLIFPRAIYAYLDPGTGSYILQIVLAAFVGVAFTIKIYWVKVKTFFINLFSKKS